MTADVSPTHGVITYDVFDEWLVETDIGGAARIVARDVPQWFGQLVEELCAAPPPLDGLEAAFTEAVNARSKTGRGLAVPHHRDVEAIWQAIFATFDRERAEGETT